MRTTTLAERTILDAAHRWHHMRILVEDASGNFQDLTNLLETDWVAKVSWRQDVDAPITELNVTFHREHGGVSLSPFRGDSAANVGGAAIDAGRAIQVWTATTAHGVLPVAGDWKHMFDGEIDSFDAAKQIPIVARDLSGRMVDAQVEDESEYGSEDGLAIETTMQNILDDWAPEFTLYTPSAPGFLINTYKQQKEAVWDALRANAGLIGWDTRLVWVDAFNSFRPKFFEPDRTASVPVWTFGPDRYFDVQRLAVDRTHIRNAIRVTYTDAETGERASVTRVDAASITRFRRRWMEIEEAADSPIDSEAEAQDLLDAALSDLSFPPVDQVIELPYFWAVELGDLLEFEANGVHYDDNQLLAVVSIQHDLEPNRERTLIGVRGKPIGFYRDWIRRGNTTRGRAAPDLIPDTYQTNTEGLLRLIGRNDDIVIKTLQWRGMFDDVWGDWINVPDTTLPTEFFTVALHPRKLSKIGYEATYIDAQGNERQVGDEVVFGLLKLDAISLIGFQLIETDDVGETYGGNAGELVARCAIFARTYPDPLTEAPAIRPDDLVDVIETSPGDLVAYRFPYPQQGTRTFGWFIPKDAEGNTGRIERVKILPLPAGNPYFTKIRQSHLNPLKTTFSGQVVDPGEQSGVLYVWGPNVDPTGPPSGSVVVAETPFAFGPTTNFDGAGFVLLDMSVPKDEPQSINLQFIAEDGRTTGVVRFDLESPLSMLVDALGRLQGNSVYNAFVLADNLRPYHIFATHAEKDAITEADILGDEEVVGIGDRALVVEDYSVWKWNFTTDAYEPDPDVPAFGYIPILTAGVINATLIASLAIRTKLAFVEERLNADHIAINTLSELSTDVGIVLDGVLRNFEGDAGLDLGAEIDEPFLWHDGLVLWGEGSDPIAEFMGRLVGADGDFSGDLTAGTVRAYGGVHLRQGLIFDDDDFGVPDTEIARIQAGGKGERKSISVTVGDFVMSAYESDLDEDPYLGVPKIVTGEMFAGQLAISVDIGGDPEYFAVSADENVPTGGRAVYVP